MFPLTRHMLLVGEFNRVEYVAEATREFVAAANLEMIRHSFDQVYADTRVFPYLGPDGGIYNDRDVMERFAKWRMKNPQGGDKPQI